LQLPNPGPFAENNTVHGRLYRCAERWQERPTVLLLHGWNDAIESLLPVSVHGRGNSIATGSTRPRWKRPFHFQRRPRQLGAWSNFLCPDILRTVEAVRQAVAETRAFAEWLRQQGCPAVGLMGVSLGGWLAGWPCAMMPVFLRGSLVPVARLDRLVEEAAFCRCIRLALARAARRRGKLNLTKPARDSQGEHFVD
jgi:pimeloyl-ACP methyl ester carboxylesterase